MGQYRFQLSFIPGIGAYITWTKQEITVAVPFFVFYFGLTKDARGYNILGKWGK